MKFVEMDYEKVDRLLDIREGAEARSRVTDKEIERERRASLYLDDNDRISNPITQDMIRDGEDIDSEVEDLWYLRRLDGGLFTLQTVDYILGWICMEDDGVCHVSISHPQPLTVLIGPRPCRAHAQST